jgi:hypothetical protein
VQKVLFLAAVLWSGIPLLAQDSERALRPDTAEFSELGKVRMDFGVEFLHRARYSLSGLEGDLLRLGIMDLRFGVGDNAEFQISGVGHDFLSITGRKQPILPTSFAGDTTSDFGDLLLGAKLKLASAKGARPALAFKFAIQLPNASNESGLGTDEINFFSSILASKRIGRALVSGNLGFAIYSSPISANSQDDMMIYGASIALPVHDGLEIIGEIHGRQGPICLGTENIAQVRAGARISAAGLKWDLTAIGGLREFDPRSGLAVGVSYEFQGFHRNQGPVTIRPESK